MMIPTQKFIIIIFSILIFKMHQDLSLEFVDRGPNTKLLHEDSQSAYMNLNLEYRDTSYNMLNSVAQEVQYPNAKANPLRSFHTISPQVDETKTLLTQHVAHKENSGKQGDSVHQKPHEKFFDGLQDSDEFGSKPKNRLDLIFDQSSSLNKKLSVSAKPFKPRKLVRFEPVPDLTKAESNVFQEYKNGNSQKLSQVMESDQKQKQPTFIDKKTSKNERPSLSNIKIPKVKGTQQHSKFVPHSPISDSQGITMIDTSQFEWEYEKLLEYEKMVSQLISEKASTSTSN
ncbi:hypothetical protein DFH28DRAFT_960175 [Melampsora americana]|nr:hypothetical protein DFH28DRAFT_960175 [Melampsora americana]